MITLIIGGSGSGKSAYAEEYICKKAGDCRKYYLATMQVYDDEGRKKVEKHRQQRQGKGFYTIEMPRNVEKTVEVIKNDTNVNKNMVLLECISNLTANEMFTDQGTSDCETVSDKIIEGIVRLNASVDELVIVTNNVFEEGDDYEEGTMEYLRALGRINERLASMADRVVEIVAGIPVEVK